MKNLNRCIVILIFVALIHVIGCGATTNAPTVSFQRGAGTYRNTQKDNLTTKVPTEMLLQEAFGEWVSIIYRTGGLESGVYGELIAIHANQLFILTAQGLTSISTDSISGMRLIKHSYRRMRYPDKLLSEFLPYARFPEGLPKAVDRQSMRLSVQWEAVTAAEQDAYAKFNIVRWLMVGCVGCTFYGCGPILTYRHEPGIPSDLVATRLLGKSPEYVAIYTFTYKKKTKSLRLNGALSGFACGVGCVGGIFIPAIFLY